MYVYYVCSIRTYLELYTVNEFNINICELRRCGLLMEIAIKVTKLIKATLAEDLVRFRGSRAVCLPQLHKKPQLRPVRRNGTKTAVDSRLWLFLVSMA